MTDAAFIERLKRDAEVYASHCVMFASNIAFGKLVAFQRRADHEPVRVDGK